MTDTTNTEFDRVQKIEQLAADLKQIDIFAHLQRPERIDLAYKFHKKSFQPHEIIIQQGGQVHFFYIIVSGEAMLFKHSETQPRPTKPIILGKFNYFGGVPMFMESTSRATVQVKTELECFVMKKEKFQEFVIPILKFIEKNAQAYHEFIQTT